MGESLTAYSLSRKGSITMSPHYEMLLRETNRPRPRAGHVGGSATTRRRHSNYRVTRPHAP
jgi:hypothetical protein